MRKGDLILGWGMAAASWGAGRGACQASVTLKDDGTAYASCATQDIGTGTYTVLAQVVRERTGIAIAKIDVVLGDTSLVPGPTSGGSTATATFSRRLRPRRKRRSNAASSCDQRSRLSVLNQDPATLTLSDGRMHNRNQASSADSVSESAEDGDCRIRQRRQPHWRSGVRHQRAQLLYPFFGAQFVEVEWDPGSPACASAARKRHRRRTNHQ